MQGQIVAFKIAQKGSQDITRAAIVLDCDSSGQVASLGIFPVRFADNEYLPGEVQSCADGYIRRHDVKRGAGVGEWQPYAQIQAPKEPAKA